MPHISKVMQLKKTKKQSKNKNKKNTGTQCVFVRFHGHARVYVCVWEGGAVSYTAELLSITVYLNNTVDFKHGAYEVQGRCAR